MTIKELYEWAIENEVENKEIYIDENCYGGYYPELTDIIIEKYHIKV